MKRIISLPGVVLPDAVALPAIPRTPEGRAMGGVPGWRMLLDPAYEEPTRIRNRALPSAFQTREGSLSPQGVIGGQPAFALSTAGPRYVADTPINPGAWSFFSVVKAPVAGATGGRELMRGDTISSPSALLQPRVAIRPNGHVALFGTDSLVVRLDAPTIPDDIAFVLMATSSTRDGLRIFYNQVEVAANPADKAALNDQIGAGQFRMLRNTSGTAALLCGMTGLLDIDLGWAEHAGYRRSIIKFLMAKYGIA